MSSAKVFNALLGLLLITTVAAFAAIEDYTWSFSGASSWSAGENIISIAVGNETTFSSAVIEVNYDPTFLEIGTADPTLVDGTDFEKVGERMDSISVIGSKPLGTSGVVRLTILSLAETEGYTHIVTGTGDIVKLVFRVKSGVSSGNTTLELVSAITKASLATHEIEIQGLSDAGNPADFTWSMSGVMVAGSQETEVFVLVKNSLWFSSVALDVFFDTNALEVKQPLEDNVTLVKRAAVMNLTSAQEASSDYVRLTVSGSELDPTTPRIDAGRGTIAKLNFNVKTPLSGGESTTLQLKLSDGTELASLIITAREYTGPTADITGDGKENIFDLIGFIHVLAGNTPSSVFSDVNGDGKTNIFDLLEILNQLISN